MLEFMPPDVEEEKHMIDALRTNDSARVEIFLQGPRNPNLSGGHGSKPFILSKVARECNVMSIPFHKLFLFWPICAAQNIRVK
jgi:hypothetical protein